MRVIIQRVKRAALTAEIESAETGEKEMQSISNINEGLLCLLGIHREDTWEDASYIIKKCLNLKLWKGDNKRWDKCVKDLGYSILIVSQFTLYAITHKGSKPDFHLAKESNEALIMYNKIVEEMGKEYNPEKIKTGKFGHYMNIDVINDGPVTIYVDTHDIRPNKKCENSKKSK